jgi:hypothetical protein
LIHDCADLTDVALGQSEGVAVGVAGPWRSIPCQPHVRHQLDRNHGIHRAMPRDCNLIVTALQLRHLSVCGKIQRNTTVAAIMRSTKIEMKTTAKIAASDIMPPPATQPADE